MSVNLNRRSFLKKSLITSAGIASGLSFEEKALLAKTTKKTIVKVSEASTKALPMGKIGNLKISRLICGGNLIGGHAHARDLMYVSSLVKAYNTDEKVMETLQICEENGINTIVVDPTAVKIINKYWKERGGKIQWIVEAHPRSHDLKTNIKKSIDNGAVAAYIQGVIGDKWVKQGRVELIEKVVEFIKANGIPAGIGAHSLDVLIECETAGIDTDFYVKTLHSGNYWSAKRPDQHQDVVNNPRDNYWSVTPEQTIEFMKKVDKPWIAFKVLAAGAIHPLEGFKYAFNNGADFVIAGMFDFQVVEDAIIAKNILSKLSKVDRERPWRG